MLAFARTILIAVAVAGPVGFAAGVDDAFPERLSLADARQIALRHNPDLKAASASVDGALAALKVAREYPNPTLGLSTSGIDTDGRTNTTYLGNSLWDRSYDSVASLSQLILVAKRGLQRQAADAGVRQARSQLDDVRRLLVQSVTTSYAAGLAATEQADALTQSAAQLAHEAEIAARRLAAGDISRADKDRIDLAAGQDELSADSQRAAAKSAVVALENLLGYPSPAGATQLTDSLGSLAADAMHGGLETLNAAERPDVAAAQAAVDQADANLSLQRRQRVPDLTLSVQYERQPPDQPNTVGLGVSLPLPLWNHYNGEIAGARATRDQAQAQLDKVRAQAAADVASARIAYLEASRRAQRYRDELTPASRRATGSVAYAYNRGGAALVDLLDAEQADNQVRVAAVQAQADAASAAITLLSALGRLDEAGSGRLPISP